MSYKTGQRKNIMDYLIKNKDKFINAEEILEYMKKNKQEVGLTTIYRFLNLLEKDIRESSALAPHHCCRLDSMCDDYNSPINIYWKIIFLSIIIIH